MAKLQAAHGVATLRWRDECRDFLRFIRHPRLTPRLPHTRLGSVWRVDWFAGVSVVRLLQWALLLWVLNVVLLGPIAVAAAQFAGAKHRLWETHISLLQALLWAPVVEELVFRYGLRRLGQALWVVPAATVLLISGMHWATGLLCVAITFVLVNQARRTDKPLDWSLRKTYQRVFPYVFYASTTLFALVHLINFNFHQAPLWILPLLVLPQWCTGLVLGWLRVRRGIGAAIWLHAIFNGGPMLLIVSLRGLLSHVPHV